MSSRLIYICAVILLVGIQEIRAPQRDTIVIHDTVYVAVSLVYMLTQALVILGYFCFVGYGYWYLLGIIVLLSSIYVLFMRKYFHFYVQQGKK